MGTFAVKAWQHEEAYGVVLTIDGSDYMMTPRQARLLSKWLGGSSDWIDNMLAAQPYEDVS